MKCSSRYQPPLSLKSQINMLSGSRTHRFLSPVTNEHDAILGKAFPASVNL